MSHSANLDLLSDEQRHLLDYAERVQREATELASGLRARLKRRGDEPSGGRARPEPSTAELVATESREPVYGCGDGCLMGLGEATVSAVTPQPLAVEATTPSAGPGAIVSAVAPVDSSAAAEGARVSESDPPEITASHFEMLPTPLPVREERAGAQRRKSLQGDRPNLDEEALRAMHITHFSVTLPLRWWQRRAVKPYLVAAAACLATVILGMLLSLGGGEDEGVTPVVAEPVATIEELVGPPTPSPAALTAAIHQLETTKAREPARRVAKRGARHQRR